MSQCSTCEHFHDGKIIHRCSLGLEATDTGPDGEVFYLGSPAVGDGNCDRYEKQIIEDGTNVG